MPKNLICFVVEPLRLIQRTQKYVSLAAFSTSRI